MTNFEKILLEKFKEEKCPRARYICELFNNCHTCALNEKCSHAKADNEIENWLREEVEEQ